MFSLVLLTASVLCMFGTSFFDFQYRSSRPEVFYKKGLLRNFAKCAGKRLCESFFFNKVAGLRHGCFPVNFTKFLRTPFLIEHLRWLLLSVVRTPSHESIIPSRICYYLFAAEILRSML